MRIVREILFSVLLLRCSGVLAQVFDDEPYYPFAPYEEERMPELESDSLLFYRAVQLTTFGRRCRHSAFRLFRIAGGAKTMPCRPFCWKVRRCRGVI